MLPIESLIHRYGITYNAALEQGLSLLGNVCLCVCVCVCVCIGEEGVLCLGVHWLYHKLYHPEAVGLLEC